VLVSLPDDDDGEQAAVTRLAAVARDELAAMLGVVAPPGVTLRFHPTASEFERATGRPWFALGAWVGNQLHLLPLAVLRERGLLDRTIRHEIVHALADQVLQDRPAWVREGAALYFAGEKPVTGGAGDPARRPAPRAACPRDNELLQPISAGGLTDAYARARSCFARQIAAGRSWREVR
jgi:hypothetical protein